MGGDTTSPPTSSTGTLSPGSDDEVSVTEQDFPNQFDRLPTNPSLEANQLVFGDSDAWNDLLGIEANRIRMCNVYSEVLRSYDELKCRIESLEELKTKVLSYTPGAWVENVGGMKLSDYDVPETTTLLLIGPKGSGKSSLVNRISRVFEDDKFAPERAQVTYSSSSGDGTSFLHEYMIPRSSTSFCLYDTRSFSDDTPENIEMVNRWMMKRIRHGVLVRRDSDSSSVKARMRSMARQNQCCSREGRMVNFVIFVVNGLSVLKSIDSDGEGTNYSQMIATIYNSPFLSFKDDKPVVVVTHGDLLPLSARARVRVHLGELLSIHPKAQVFDIPDSSEPTTELAIVDMLRYSLEHADRNLPRKGWLMSKARLYNDNEVRGRTSDMGRMYLLNTLDPTGWNTTRSRVLRTVTLSVFRAWWQGTQPVGQSTGKHGHLWPAPLGRIYEPECCNAGG